MNKITALQIIATMIALIGLGMLIERNSPNAKAARECYEQNCH